MNTPKQTHTPGPWRWLNAAEANIAFGEYDLARLVGPLYDTTVNNIKPGRIHEVCSFGNSETYYPTEGTEPSDADKRLIAAAPDLLAAIKIQHECGPPEKASLYDEECVEGWRWTHPDGREWTEIGDWNEPPPMHPEVSKAIAKAEGGAA